MNRQDIAIALKLQAVRRYLGAEDKKIRLCGCIKVVDRVHAVAEVEYIGVIAGIAVQLIVSGPAGQGIVAVTAMQLIEPLVAVEPVGKVGAGERIIARVALNDECILHQLPVVDDRAVGELVVLHRARPQIGVVGIEARQMDLIARGADADDQLAVAKGEAVHQIRQGDAGSEFERVTAAGIGRIVDDIHPIAQIEDVGVIALPAGECVVAMSAGQRIVAGATGQAIHRRGAGQRIVTSRAG